MSLPVLHLIIDDQGELPRFAAEFADVQRFGDLLRRRRSMVAAINELADASGLEPPLRLPEDERQLLRTLSARGSDRRLFLILPTCLASTAADADAVLFLRKLALLTEPTSLWRGRVPSGAVVIDEAGLAEYLQLPAEATERWRQHQSARLPAIDDGLRLADLREPTALLEYLSGSFAARHFNEVTQERWVVVKRSSDVDKMRREYRYYGLLPERLQPYFVQPFDFAEDEGGASYRMHRILVPDLAVQWIHHAFSPEQFDRLLEQLMRFVDEREVRAVGDDRGREIADHLYGAKVEERITAFLATDVGRDTDALLAAGGRRGGLRSLQQRYNALRASLEQDRAFGHLAITHGDLCFSNVLFNPAGRSVHLIDPRGADTVDELFSDPYYDLAKLSHSICGGYDLIVAEQTRPAIGQGLELGLVADHEPDPELPELFRTRLAERGFDPTLVRLYEASLFLSMLPLHIDEPTRVLALALRGAQILDQLESTQ